MCCLSRSVLLYYVYSVDVPDRDDSRPRGDKAHGTGFHHAAQNGTRFKMYELFISWIFQFNIFGRQWTMGN